MGQKANANVSSQGVIARLWQGRSTFKLPALHEGIHCGRGRSKHFLLLSFMGLFGFAMLSSSMFKQPTEIVVSYQTAGDVDAPADWAEPRALRRAATPHQIDDIAGLGLGGVHAQTIEELAQELKEEVEQIEDGATRVTTESFMQAERMEYLARHNLLDESDQSRLQHFDDAFANMFPVTTETVKTIKSIRELHATYPADKPKACVMILVYPVHCGMNCIAPMSKERSCTQDRAVRMLLRNIHDKFLQRNPYPVVLLHQDLTEADMEGFRAATGATLFFQRVIFDEDTLPSYLDKEAFLSWIRPKHPDNDIQIPSTKLHGFGYRMMCRLFSGLLFHAPVMREFDYYIRVDGGDSRVWELDWDPFVRMSNEGTSYAYLKTGANFLNFLGPVVFDYLDEHPEVQPERQLLCSSMNCDTRAYRDKYYYNNFEAVYMPAFRKKEYWDFFVHLDQLNLIVCNYDQEAKQCRTGGGDWEYKHVGDGDFRTVSVGLVLNSSQVKQWTDFPYVHPVPDWCQE